MAQLESGLAISTLPSAGSVTLTVTATVTAAGGTVSNTAAVTAPVGVSDPSNANDSATDTDSVVAAVRRADLAVSKTDGMTELIPGQTTVYTIVVTNLGPDAVTGATLTDAAPAGLTFGSWTCVASAGSGCPASGAGSLSATLNLLSGGTATFTVPATVAQAAPDSISNAASVANPIGIIDPVLANNTATDVDRMAPQRVAVGIRAGAPTVVGPATFDVPYTIDVSNVGAIPLTNLQVSDSLSTAFADGRPTLTLASPVTTTAPCAANGGFSGIGPDPSAGTNLLSGSGSLAVGRDCTINFVVRVTYSNASAVPKNPQTNRVTARTFATPGGAVQLAKRKPTPACVCCCRASMSPRC